MPHRANSRDIPRRHWHGGQSKMPQIRREIRSRGRVEPRSATPRMLHVLRVQLSDVVHHTPNQTTHTCARRAWAGADSGGTLGSGTPARLPAQEFPIACIHIHTRLVRQSGKNSRVALSLSGRTIRRATSGAQSVLRPPSYIQSRPPSYCTWSRALISGL